MKAVKINLAERKNIPEKLYLGLAALIVFITCGFTMVNSYDYYANTDVIKTYETRLEKINKRSEQKKVKAQKRVNASKEDEKIKQDFNYLKAIVTKNMFPLTEVLTQIEKVKLDKIDINELIFSDNLKSVMIKGASSQVSVVSKFLMEMNRSKYFVIELSKEEIDNNKRIMFELTAKWIII
jgi:hypothetical protein